MFYELYCNYNIPILMVYSCGSINHVVVFTKLYIYDDTPVDSGHRLLMAATDAGGAHAVSWASNNAEMRARLGTCLACGTPIFTRAVADAPLVEGSFRKPYYSTACPARLAINNYK